MRAPASSFLGAGRDGTEREERGKRVESDSQVSEGWVEHVQEREHV